MSLIPLEQQSVETQSLKSILNTILVGTQTNHVDERKKISRDSLLKILDVITTELRGKNERNDYLITEDLIGALIQDVISDDRKKKSGSYYTPIAITTFIAKTVLERHVVDSLNQHLNLSLKSNNEVFQALNSNLEMRTKLLEILEEVTVLEPSLGTGHFIIAMTEILSNTWMQVILSSQQTLEEFTRKLDKNTKNFIEQLAIEEDYDVFRAVIKVIVKVTYCIPALYGADINPVAILASKIRLFINLLDTMPSRYQGDLIPFISKRLDFNFMVGDSLLGFTREEDFHGSLTENIIGETNEQIFHSLKIIKETLDQWTPCNLTDNLMHSRELDLFWNHSLNKFTQSACQSLVNGNNPKKLQENLVSLFHDYMTLKTLIKRMKRGDSNAPYDDKIDDLMKKIDDAILTIVNAIWKEITNTRGLENRDVQPIHWFLAFPEVFHEKRGFDLVIGNPPYLVEVRSNKDTFRMLKRSPLGKKYYEQKIDIFYLFISLGIDVLKHGGILGFIVPEYWINRRFARKLRQKIFNETVPLAFVFFGDHIVFPHAPGHHDMILFLKKQPFLNTLEEHETVIWQHDCTRARCEKSFQVNWLLDATIRKKFINEVTILTRLLYDADSDILHVTTPRRVDKFKRMKQHAWFLKSSEIQLGLTAPQNEVTSRALKKFPRSRWKVGEGIFALRLPELKQYTWTDDEIKLFRIFFTARAIGPFEFSTTIQRLILYMDQENLRTLRKFPRHHHNVITHLNRFKQLITSDHGPHGLHRARQPAWFEDASKIIGARKTSQPKFAVVPLPYHVDLSCIILRLHQHDHISPYFVVGVLNSSVGREILHYLKHQGDQLQVDKSVLLKFPFPRPTPEYHEIISWLSKSLHCVNIARHYMEMDKIVKETLFDLLEQVVTPLVEQQALPKTIQKLLKAVPPLTYPAWIETPSITEIIRCSSSQFTLKVKKQPMEKDIRSIKTILKCTI